MLELTSLSRHFGGLKVLQDVNLSVPAGSIFGLIGPNGAGKTTVFNLITGLLPPSSGGITFDGASLVGRRPHMITRGGIARTFQNIRIFKEMTLLDNVVVGMHSHLGYGTAGLLFALPAYRAAERRGRGPARGRGWGGERGPQRPPPGGFRISAPPPLGEAPRGLRGGRRATRPAEHPARQRRRELLSWVKLDHKADDIADNLSYGDQRKLELARALATEPRLLLLDEPVAGMNTAEKTELMREVVNIRQRGYTVFMIEHDMRFVMGLCERIAVLNFGRIIAEGDPDAIRNDPQVIEAYLGRDDEEQTA